MTRESIHDLFAFAGPEWATAVIAGGYAVEPTKAQDVDLWLPAIIDTTFELRANAILERLTEDGIEHEPNLRAYPNDLGDRYLVATIPEGFDKKDVQVLITSHRTAQGLVDSFDISTHMLALDLNTRSTFGKEYTHTGQRPKVCRWDTPTDTLKRLFKICSRYNLTPLASDVMKLEALAAAERQMKAAA